MYSVQNTKYTSVYSYKNSSSKDVRSLDTKEWENGEPMSLWEEEPSKNNQGESRQSAYDRKQEEEEKGKRRRKRKRRRGGRGGGEGGRRKVRWLGRWGLI